MCTPSDIFSFIFPPAAPFLQARQASRGGKFFGFGGGPDLPPPPKVPTVELPDPQKIEAEARAAVLKRQRKRTRVIFTNPAGIEDEPDLAKASLLGSP